VQRQRAEVAEARPGWYWWAIMILTVATFSGGSIYASARNQHRSEITLRENQRQSEQALRENQRQSEQALCEVIILSQNAYRKNPAPSVTVRELSAAMDRLSSKYHCATR